MRYDSVLLVAFGGPTPGCCQKYNNDMCPGEAYCFVEGIAGEAESQKERVKDISAHYVKLGGFSPFNELTFKQADALKTALQARDLPLPVYAGFRHWNPYLKEVIAEMVQNGHRKILGIIMAPHQSKVSWEWYQQEVKKGIDAVAGEKPTIDYLDPWYTHKGYVGAVAEIIETACGDKLDRAELVFTAHAIPQVAADTSPYTQQFEKTGEAVAKQIGKTRFGLAYQSEVENSPIPWTQPDINDWLKAQKKEDVDTVVASPIGFLCDHVEVLYDLDIEATETAEVCDIDFIRAGTVGDHPKFIGMLADFVCKKTVKRV
ncbi:ferrochelatase [Candidatus Poribacteria bacterium]|nr:MAG: ferrochelatase [Candidatus Poribacteria bacterium]